jgi:hypothetical protein
MSHEFIKLLIFVIKPKAFFQKTIEIPQGENKIKGLIHFCGRKDIATPENAHIVCTSGLRLFNLLLDFEFNKGFFPLIFLIIN